GERVAEAPLAERLGMSRTPVRQALPVLAQEGLLAEHQTRGYVVRGFSTADVLDAIDLRGVLEGLAARRVAERGVSRTLLQALRVCLAEGDQILAEGHVADKVEALMREHTNPVKENLNIPGTSEELREVKPHLALVR